VGCPSFLSSEIEKIRDFFTPAADDDLFFYLTIKLEVQSAIPCSGCAGHRAPVGQAFEVHLQKFPLRQQLSPAGQRAKHFSSFATTKIDSSVVPFRYDGGNRIHRKKEIM